MDAVDLATKRPVPYTPFHSLEELEQAALRDLEMMVYPSKKWLEPVKREDGAHVYDAVVVGGGHCGITAGFALIREKVENILVLDESPVGFEGPWKTYARMPDLRTLKSVIGTDLGYSNLTYRAFYEARRGVEAYHALERIPCDEWTDYLLWLRKLLRIPVENEAVVDLIEPQGNLFRLSVRRQGRSDVIWARRVVLAWGPLRTGGPVIPDAVRALPAGSYQHVYDLFDVSALKGKRVIVVGAGASAFDNAGAALENGAAEVHMLIRRPKIPGVSVIRFTDWAAYLNTYPDLDDSLRWAFAREVQRNPSPPTLRGLQRVEKWPNFHIHFASPLEKAWQEGEEIVIRTPHEQVRGDALLLATGFSVDMRLTKALAGFSDKIAVWSDRYTPPDGPGPEKFRNAPYLGRNYQFVEKVPGTAPFLGNIFNFNQSATLSMGPTGRVSGLKYGVRRLMIGVLNSLLREDFPRHLKAVKAFDVSEFEPGHPWVE